MNEVLINTDTLSYFLRNVPRVMSQANEYLKSHKGFSISMITSFEIIRGLKIKNAQQQLAKFKSIRKYSTEFNLNSKIIERAADIYSDLYSNGNIIGDADFLIAATALENGLALVTNNENHFNRIDGLQLQNWTR